MLAAVAAADAQTIEEVNTPAGGNLMRRGDMMLVDVAVDLSDAGVGSNRLMVLTPRIVNDGDTLHLETMGIYGRRRFIYNQRNESKLEDAFQDVNFLNKELPQTWKWTKSVPYQSWMDGAHLELCRNLYGCCNDLLQGDVICLSGYEEIIYVPEFIYVTPPAEMEKVREMSGSAYIDFPVSRTEIRADYRNNRSEIGKILAGLDSLRKDDDISVLSLTIKGYASPESPYANNARLAKGRTESLKKYVSQQYSFDDDFIITSYEAEDWDGLREYVAASSLVHKNEILAIIDSALDPDPKELKIRKEYPSDYKFLLDNCYPALRHSDYVIEYKIKSYVDLDEIRNVFEKEPGKLSMNEIFSLSTGYASPESPYANNARLAKGRTESLKKYVSQQYSFDDDFIITSYEAEDWDGLREYVAASSLVHKNEILAIIDSALDPDPKELKIRKEYPSDYKFLLDNCYPALRHSDYVIEYKIKSYVDLDEIRNVFEKEPGKLSMNEIFSLSTLYEPGSDSFNEVFDVAVALFPASEITNLNAANAAMERGDLMKAEKYLAKAGDSPQSTYAAGVLSALKKEYLKAKELFLKASEGGISKAAETADSMDEFILRSGNNINKY